MYVTESTSGLCALLPGASLSSEADGVGGPSCSDSPKLTMSGKRGVLAMLGFLPIRRARRSDL